MNCVVVAAAFDHVSRHVITDAMEAMRVPPVVVAAWIREYTRSETLVELDHIKTSGFKRTNVSVGEVELLVNGGCLGQPLFADNCWIAAMFPVELQRSARAWNELLMKV